MKRVLYRCETTLRVNHVVLRSIPPDQQFCRLGSLVSSESCESSFCLCFRDGRKKKQVEKRVPKQNWNVRFSFFTTDPVFPEERELKEKSANN
jgi:hypothetical protein